MSAVSGVARKSNCIVFALRRFWQRGGYLIIRKSRWGWFPHVLWSADLETFESFSPCNPTHRTFPPVFFRGYIKVGDA